MYRLNTGDNKSVDVESSSFQVIEKPRIAVLTGGGVNGLSAGQIWHLLDTKYKVPFTLLPIETFSRANLSRYNVIVFPNGNYQSLDEQVVKKLQAWLSSGNTLIAFENAASWLNRNKLIQAEFEKDESKATGYSYENALLYDASREIPGSVFEARLDLTHPLNYGYKHDLLPVFKDNDIIQVKAENISSGYPVRYTKAPLLDGYAPVSFTQKLAETPALGIFSSGRGRIIVFYNNSNFRGYWPGTNRQFANSLFFGDKIRLSSGMDRW